MYLALKSNLFSSPNFQANWAKLKNQPILTDKSRSAVAGFVGGSVATFALHPLDLLKTRQAVHCNGSNQVAKERYSKVTRAIGTVLKENGFKGLYSGVKSNVMLSGSSWGIYFLSYGMIKSSIGSNQFNDTLLAACGAGVMTTVLTNPLSVARTRLILSTTSVGLFNQVRDIFKKNGFRGFYKGLVPNVLGVSHGALQLVAYEYLKKSLNNGQVNSTANTLLACVASKMFAAVLTYPLQNIRACQMASDSAFKVKFSLKSVPGFYKGMVPYLFHVVPNVCIVFLVYETVAGN